MVAGNIKIAIVTSIIGVCDTLKEQCAQSIPVDWICYTNQDFKSDTWDIRRSEKFPEFKNDNLRGLYYKLQTHKILKDYDYIIYICGSVEITNPNYAVDYINYASYTGLANFYHPERRCAYDELEFCKPIKKYIGEPIHKQIDFYKKEKFPRNYGLWACTDFVRACNDETDNFFDTWWSYLNEYAINDQMSLPYISWALDIIPFTIPGNQRENKYYIKHKHIKSWENLKKRV